MINKFENHDEHGKLVKFVDSRFYMLPDKPDVYFPGITTILNIIDKGDQYKHWLQSNGFNANVLAREAMDQGSHVHEAIQDFLNGKEIRWATEDFKFFTRHEWEMISRFIDFYTAFKPQTMAVEKVLVSEKLGYGTQLDYICRLNDEMIYIDHKTGSVYDSASMQIAASIQLWNEKFPADQISRGAVLHLESAHRGRDKTGKSIQGKGWKLIFIDDTAGNFEDFKHAQALWKRKNPIIKPFNVQYPDRYSVELTKEITLPDE